MSIKQYNNQIQRQHDKQLLLLVFMISIND